MWLAESLLGAVGPDLGDVTILGGWFGVLGAVLLHDPRFAIRKRGQHRHRPALRRDRRVAQRDARARRPLCGNDGRHAGSGLCAPRSRPAGRTAGRSRHQHQLRASRGVRPLVRAHSAGQASGAPVERLFRVRAARQLRTRSRGFQAQAPMRDVLFAGERRMRRYVRFMLIGDQVGSDPASCALGAEHAARRRIGSDPTSPCRTPHRRRATSRRRDRACARRARPETAMRARRDRDGG